jgi:DNA-binding winged helix-turn-helix (wHTH) protein
MNEIYEFNEFRLETAEHRLLRAGSAITLAPKVFDTLVILVENSGRLLSKDELMQKLWPNTFVEEVSLAQNISQLRKALGYSAGDGQMIQTVAKRGYRFNAPMKIVTEGQPSNGSSTLQGLVSSPAAFERRLGPNSESAPSRWKAVTVLAATTLAIVALASAVIYVRTVKTNATPVVRSIAVLPLAIFLTIPIKSSSPTA